jgi:hypothetical protein
MEKKKRGRPAGAGRPKGSSNTTVITDPLINPYKIYVDTNCYTVVDKDKKDENDPLEIEKSYGYFNTLGSALNKIIRMKTTSNKTYTIQQYVEEYKTMLDEFKAKFNF